ncbi:hypothetical protein TWF696_005300 [Orbilia brochopaga]|uniref:Uncharacterized protein n=1 Tax=Orbilia brochopaga TaxID=3140254 RepID=A0AAV9V0E3_9PEZI
MHHTLLDIILRMDGERCDCNASTCKQGSCSPCRVGTNGSAPSPVFAPSLDCAAGLCCLLCRTAACISLRCDATLHDIGMNAKCNGELGRLIIRMSISMLSHVVRVRKYVFVVAIDRLIRSRCGR